MNILIITNSNPYVNAGIVANYLYTGFKSKGHNAKILVREYGKYKNKDIVCIEKQSDVVFAKLKNKVKKISTNLFNFKNKNHIINEYTIHDYDHTIQYYKTNDILKYIDFKPDIIFYLFPQKFLNAKNLFELNKSIKAPIFWYLMDSVALTGGCHFFWDCKGYTTGCGKCPGMNSTDENDQSAINFNFKKYYLDKTDIHIISGTERLLQQSRESLLFKNKPIHKILLPIDHKIFKPVLKSVLREELDLPKQKKIIFFGAGSLNAKRKGMKYLTEALKLIYDQHKDMDLLLLIAGNHFEFIKDDLLFEYKYLGVLENNTQLASAFQVSDVFVNPSIEDAGPMMINQSIMCGTPVVSFEMGVAFDLVIPKKTGYLAELRNIDDLAKGINEILSLKEEEQQIMSKNCRNFALENITQNVFVNKFEKILTDL